MSLVQYPDSDSDEADNTNAIAVPPAQDIPKSAGKRKHSGSQQEELPPLPAAFHDLYSINARVSTTDNPSLHGGRKRAVPHVEGNWPSHIYLEWIPSQTESDCLHNLIQHVRDLIDPQNTKSKKRLPIPDIIPSLQSDLGTSVPLHVSLSRTLQIKTEDREPFLESLTTSLRRVAVRAFHFHFHGLKWVPNYERNRWFLVLSIVRPEHDELNRLLGACNEAAEINGHPGLYTGGEGDGPGADDVPNYSSKRRKSQHDELESERRIDYSSFFHISVAWNLAEPDPAWISLVEGVDVEKPIQSPQATFSAIKARIGNVVHNIALGSKRESVGRGGLLGLG